MEKFFKSALDDPDLQLKLREDGNIFFLHLLGCDTNGHVHKPHSAHYRDNINTVDEGVRISAANRSIGEVVQSRRRPLLGPSPG